MTFPKSRDVILKKMVVFQKLNHLVVNKPFVDFRQNRQYRDWTKIIIILRAIHLWDCGYSGSFPLIWKVT